MSEQSLCMCRAALGSSVNFVIRRHVPALATTPTTAQQRSIRYALVPSPIEVASLFQHGRESLRWKSTFLGATCRTCPLCWRSHHWHARLQLAEVGTRPCCRP